MLLPSAAAAVSTLLSRRPSLPQKNDGPASHVRGQGSARPLAWRNVAVHEPDFCWRTTIRLSKPTVPPLAAFLNSSTHEQKINCISRESNTGLAETVRSKERLATANFTTKPLKRSRIA
jgi:hypothetical protein